MKLRKKIENSLIRQGMQMVRRLHKKPGQKEEKGANISFFLRLHAHTHTFPRSPAS